LSLSGTNVADLFFLKGLKGLTSLSLSGTNISDLSFLKDLKGLTSLSLSGTNVADLFFLKGLKRLTSLGLFKTSVSDLSIIESLPSLVRIHLVNAGNLVEPPLHIAKMGHEEIRNYFRQKREQGTGYLYEAKVLIVGEPGAGKTSLRKKLIEPGYVIPNNEEISTLGIEVEKDWNFPYMKDNKITFHASLWDFGGQDIQYMIHQYFLTGKSLYILVADERKQNTHYEYWFNIIRLLGEGSPVLVVLNKREGSAISSYDHNEICKAFPDLRIEKFELDMAKEKTAFDALREKIKSMLCGLDHIGQELPAKWPLIRTSLEGMKEKNHISLDEYFDICAGHGIKDEKGALVLADYLHVLGTVLHFKDDDLLRDLVITNHNWVVDALYTALSNKQIEEDCGRFTREWLFNLWKNPKQSGKKGYSDEECRQLLNLMKKEKFELCYELDEKDQFISPQLLPQTPPDYRLNFSGGLEFRFRYPFMPEGLISRLIVRLNHLIRKEQGRQVVWRYGAVLEREGCIAEITQTRFSSEGYRDISVRVIGTDYRKKELLTSISNEIESIHRKSFKHVNFKILIPCNSAKCSMSGNPKLFALDELNKLVGFGDDSTRCTECGELVAIYSLVVGMAPDSRIMPSSFREKISVIRSPDTVKYVFHRFEDQAESGLSEMSRRVLDILECFARNPAHAIAIANSTS
ncbi:MAG: COR domain-containing protein, partial [Deltaproteobacteria bacterium]